MREFIQRMIDNGPEPELAPPLPKPKRPEIDDVEKEYGEFAERFADPEAFLDRIRSGEPGVAKLADAMMANPDIMDDEFDEDKFEALLSVQNNLIDEPDEREFLLWGNSLRENELRFVAEMGPMKSSKMESFVRNCRLVFGGPSALNPDNPILIKVAKQNIASQPEGVGNRRSYEFSRMGVSKISPEQRAMLFSQMNGGLNRKRDHDEMEDRMFKDEREGKDLRELPMMPTM